MRSEALPEAAGKHPRRRTKQSNASPQKYAQREDFFFLGRQYNFPVALEGALKLKEISLHPCRRLSGRRNEARPDRDDRREHAEVFLIPPRSDLRKTFSNLQEIKARKGPIIAIATEGNERIVEAGRRCHLRSRRTLEPLFPLLAVIPLQLLAYHIAVARGCDVDKPRNLAKSVTVE